jgi:hypothetical protein
MSIRRVLMAFGVCVLLHRRFLRIVNSAKIVERS